MEETRVVGNYVLGPRIGSGSFAVVWLASHRSSGLEFAVKEIDKKILSTKMKDNLFKEISILSTIDHPNIIRFYEAFETSDRIFLVLEYCSGGDLARYIHRHGKLSEPVARHFMKQFAAGLQALQEKHLIHRDLKPQNLLLTNEITPLLKIGDFGFARSLTPQNLAETFCGSPLYMAPEIIQNQKYDAKADLWSAGAILFQLVTGKPPFNGNNHIQLFQNIVRGIELQFPKDALQELHPDCIDLCRRLLCRNPIQRLTFTEFFNHKFLQWVRPLVDNEQVYRTLQAGSSAASCNKPGQDIEGQCSLNQPRFVDSMELIEREYVLVNPHSLSMEASSNCLDPSLQDTGLPSCFERVNERNCSVSESGAYPVTEVKKLTAVHPLTSLKLLHQYAQALTEVACEMSDAGQVRESFAVDLVVLAVWTKALEICNCWNESTGKDLPPKPSSVGQCTDPETSGVVDLSSPASAKTWVAREFIAACNQAERSSTLLKETSVATHMPDAIETIYEKALAYGTSGGVKEYLNNTRSAATLYSKAIVLLSFIVEEAMTLPLNPPFLLTSDDKKRILFYISNLQYRQSHL